MKPLLLVDAGNTRVKWVAVRGRKLPPPRDFPTKKMTRGRVRALAQEFPTHRLMLASVVPKLTGWFKEAFPNRIELVNAGLPKLGLSFRYPKPTELGADRIAAAVAAKEAGRCPTIVVACGTATAFTALDAQGRLCGGAIAPGLQAQLDALLGATAQLPTTKLGTAPRPLGKSTQEAIRAGVVIGYQGGIKEIIAQLSAELHSRPHVILTGGNAPVAAKGLHVPCELRPLLVLEGLLIIGNRIWRPDRE